MHPELGKYTLLFRWKEKDLHGSGGLCGCQYYFDIMGPIEPTGLIEPPSLTCIESYQIHRIDSFLEDCLDGVFSLDLTTGLTQLWTKHDYILPYITFDATITEEEEVINFKNTYNERFLKQNPDVILIKPMNDTAQELYQNHSTYHEGDSGLDLFCLQDYNIGPGSTERIGLGVQCQAITSFWTLPRSSISKTPLRLANSMGLIDKGYRGELIGVVDNIKNDSYQVKKGDRLFQLAFPDLREIRPILTNFLSPTTRGGGGFGSTGK